jgi:general secretion pathway protein G
MNKASIGAFAKANTQRNSTRGVTLLEVMVVLAIMAIIAGIAIPRVMGGLERARVDAATAEVATISSQLNMYAADNSSYPSTEQGLAALINKPGGQPEALNWRGPYLDEKSIPKDPWGRPYQYLSPGQHGRFDVYSLGEDGKPGGEKNDADVGNWEP